MKQYSKPEGQATRLSFWFFVVERNGKKECSYTHIL